MLEINILIIHKISYKARLETENIRGNDRQTTILLLKSKQHENLKKVCVISNMLLISKSRTTFTQ